MKHKLYIGLIVIIFLLGVSVMSYPVVSSIVNNMNNHSEFVEYNQTVENMQSIQTKTLFEQAERYNGSLNDTVILSDPFDVEAYEKIGADYEETFNVDDKGLIGYLEVPKISVNLPIYHGTGEDVLSRGAGHLQNTSFPIGGISTHAIISAHTGLPGQTFFDYLPDMQVGDEFYVYVLDRILKYQVDQVKVVIPENIEDLRIVPNEDHVTLLTCTPYGVNSHRLLVRGVRVEYVPEDVTTESNITTSVVFWGDYGMFILGCKVPYWFMIAAIIGFIVAVVVIARAFIKRNKRKQLSKENTETITDASMYNNSGGNSDV